MIFEENQEFIDYLRQTMSPSSTLSYSRVVRKMVEAIGIPTDTGAFRAYQETISLSQQPFLTAGWKHFVAFKELQGVSLFIPLERRKAVLEYKPSMVDEALLILTGGKAAQKKKEGFPVWALGTAHWSGLRIDRQGSLCIVYFKPTGEMGLTVCTGQVWNALAHIGNSLYDRPMTLQDQICPLLPTMITRKIGAAEKYFKLHPDMKIAGYDTPITPQLAFNPAECPAAPCDLAPLINPTLAKKGEGEKETADPVSSQELRLP